MRFTVVALLAGFAAAHYSEGGPSTTSTTTKPTYSSWTYKPETCATVTETCTVTVTASAECTSTPSWTKYNTTSAQPTYTPAPSVVKPQPSYYTNGASALTGGALAIGGAVVALLM